MAAELTPKQEAFVLAFFECGNAAEAYRRAYDVAPDARDGWLYVEACQLLDHPKISLRLQQLKDQAARHSIFTRQAAMDEFEDARVLAVSIKNPAAAVAAINGKVKLFGLEAPIRSKHEHTSPDGSMTPGGNDALAIITAKLDDIAKRNDKAGGTSGK
jgi:phage terminase small subunit